MNRFWDKVKKAGPDDCWEWQPSLRKDGYGQFHYEGTMRLAHRMSFLFTHGREAEGVVMHLCNNKRCCNPAHLEDGSQQQNILMAFADGLKPLSKKLTEIERDEVRWLRAMGARNGDIAKAYGISKQHASNLVSGRRR